MPATHTRPQIAGSTCLPFVDSGQPNVSGCACSCRTSTRPADRDQLPCHWTVTFQPGTCRSVIPASAPPACEEGVPGPRPTGEGMTEAGGAANSTRPEERIRPSGRGPTSTGPATARVAPRGARPPAAGAQHDLEMGDSSGLLVELDHHEVLSVGEDVVARRLTAGTVRILE
jgi:hypothetical protein